MKKIYLLLIIFIAILVGIFANEIKKATNITVKKDTTPIISSTQFDIPIYKDDQIYGNPGAPLTIISFTDFNCKKCGELHKKLVDFVSKNPTKVRLVWKGLPQAKLIGDDSKQIHQTAYCAGLQNKFWPFVDLAMHDKKLTTKDIDSILASLKLNTNNLSACLGTEIKLDAGTTSSTLFASQTGFSKAPVIFINNYWINTDEDIDITEMLKNFIKE